MANRFSRYEPEPDHRSERTREETRVDENGQFALEKMHERRILSWSPDPDEEFEHDPQPPSPPLAQEAQQPAQSAAVRQAEPAPRPGPVDEPRHGPLAAAAREGTEPALVLVEVAQPKPSLS